MAGVAPHEPLVAAVRRVLTAAANPDLAPGMQRYMKSTMPFLGVPASVRDPLLKREFRAHLISDFGAWRDTILTLWRGAVHREERYACLSLMAFPKYANLK